MSRWFRSEPMQYISLIFNEDAAHDCLSDLGKLGVLQLTDLNPDLTPFQRKFVNFIKRCDELERKLRYFGSEIEKFDLHQVSAGTVDEFVSINNLHGNKILETLEHELANQETTLKELNQYHEQLTREYNQKVQLQEVLEKNRYIFWKDAPRLVTSKLTHQHNEEVDFLSDNFGFQAEPPVPELKFSSITGIVNTDERQRLERIMFRSTRGNCYLRFADIAQPIADPETRELVNKTVFLVFFKSQAIEIKLKKICQAFGCSIYDLPDMDDADTLDRIMTENAQELVDSRTVLLKNQDTRYKICLALSTQLERWTWIVLREKSIYHSLNMFKTDVAGMLRGEGWVVADCYEQVQYAVERAHENMGVVMPSYIDHMPMPWPTPPTYFETNKFTYGYQEFVNTYGIPRYREANPALFTAATFPFLFGVMYGDVGHGLFLFCCGLYLLWNEKANGRKKLDELTAGLHTGRYMMTMMGFFAIYAGFVYNDCFSLGFNTFGSRWFFEGQDRLDVAEGTVATQTSPYGSTASVYSFGMDPAWKVSTNELLFFNSFKMKLSVIFGVFQMFGGTLLKGANAVFFGETLDFKYEFIPMVTFSCSLFMYMVLLIFVKWSIDWNYRMEQATCFNPYDSRVWDPKWKMCSGDHVKEGEAWNGNCTPWGHACYDGIPTAEKCPFGYGGRESGGGGCQPPNLITTLINIALNPGHVEEPMFFGQAFLQVILLLVAFASVPVLLLAKPYYLQQQHSYVPITHHAHLDDDDPEADHADHVGDDGHGIGEVIIHQAIETIEFVLGMVSNTASYLRLWALSLAHSELASVFWERTLLPALALEGGVTSYFSCVIAYGFFAGVTFGVLLSMDVLECFLHALRLVRLPKIEAFFVLWSVVRRLTLSLALPKQHWVEFQNKFFKADGIKFAPFAFRQILLDAQ